MSLSKSEKAWLLVARSYFISCSVPLNIRPSGWLHVYTEAAGLSKTVDTFHKLHSRHERYKDEAILQWNCN